MSEYQVRIQRLSSAVVSQVICSALKLTLGDEFLATLPPEEAKVVYRRFQEKQSIKDIASAMRLKPRTVRMYLMKSFARIRLHLKELRDFVLAPGDSVSPGG